MKYDQMLSKKMTCIDAQTKPKSRQKQECVSSRKLIPKEISGFNQGFFTCFQAYTYQITVFTDIGLERTVHSFEKNGSIHPVFQTLSVSF